MELKDYFRIFRSNIRVFFGVVAVCVAIGWLWQYFQKSYVVSHLTLNVTRLGSENTTDYQYHDFYRLQADERFADTLVRWLGSPRITLDIYRDAHLVQAEKGLLDPGGVQFQSQRLSSQMIEVTYKTASAEDALALSRSLVRVLNTQTEALNKDQKEEAWFTVLGSEPVVSDGRTSLGFSLAVSLALGIFFGFWAVWLQYYMGCERGSYSIE